ncbi:aminotransferase class I/II-fold pyridoxal phosphate-dependent enzyme [Pseudomonas aeruginosa]
MLDEAYIEYAEGDARRYGLDYLARVIPTCWSRGPFSKAYGLASLRVGYALSSKAVADVLTACASRSMSNSLAWRLPARRWMIVATWRRVAA